MWCVKYRRKVLTPKIYERLYELVQSIYPQIHRKAKELSIMNKAIKYRLYPAMEQAIMFAKTFGCCRKIYNLMLADKIESYKTTGKFVTVTPAKYKKEYPYLKEVDSLALANKQMDLQKEGLRILKSA